MGVRAWVLAMIVRANRKTVLEPWGEMTIKHTPHYFKVLCTVPMMMHTKAWEPNHGRRGEGPGRVNLEKPWGSGGHCLQLSEGQSTQQPVCLKHRTYHTIPVSRTLLTPTSLRAYPTLNLHHGLARPSTRSLPSLCASSVALWPPLSSSKEPCPLLPSTFSCFLLLTLSSLRIPQQPSLGLGSQYHKAVKHMASGAKFKSYLCHS